MRRAAKRDANEPEIVRALRSGGYLVKQLNEFDLLVSDGQRVWMLEVKMPKGKLKPSQEQMLTDGWPLHIVRSESDALNAVRWKEHAAKQPTPERAGWER